MERKSFFKALLGLIVAPSLIKDINWDVPKVQTTGALFNDLNLIIPDYIPQLMAKYGNESYLLVWEILGNKNDGEIVVNKNTSQFTKP